MTLCWISTETASSTFAPSSGLKTSLSSSEDNNNDILNYLQREQTAVTMAQSQIVQFLHNKKISIGQEPNMQSSNQSPQGKLESLRSRIAISTAEHPIECRITLDTATENSICIAPCGCTGSQKWVQFSVFNKLRRREPKQWKTCQTCRQPYIYDLLQAQSDLEANTLGLLLDHMYIVRAGLLLSALAMSYTLQLPALVQRFLVSRAFWQMVSVYAYYACFYVYEYIHTYKQIRTPCTYIYTHTHTHAIHTRTPYPYTYSFPYPYLQYPRWSRITHLQLPLKIWLGRMLVVYVYELYARWEKWGVG
ncbi:hypothetical protein EON63_08260, partial [archaeon]